METVNEEYMLKWNSHNAELVSEFHNLCKENQFTDCTIAVEDETFKAHKLILSACSSYFKSLFSKTPCSHPVIFLKDVSSEIIGQLLQYMYLGQISVKREDLNTILQTANGLRIRGLMTDSEETRNSTLTAAPTSKSLSDNGSLKEGRKGYVPKKLRAIPHDESLIPSPPSEPMEPEQSGVSPDPVRGGTPEGSEGTPDEEQPWNLSQKEIGQAKFPILGNYLKSGSGAKKCRNGSIDDFLENLRNKNKEDIISSQQSIAQSWLEQLTAMQAEASSDDASSTIPLQESLGISGVDIAERIRAMASPYSAATWINSASNGTKASTPTIKGELGEIGPNGKPSVTCEVCGKKLADPSSLYRHRKIHSGDKPHKCPFCSRRFIQRYNMKQHMKTHRMERMENPEMAAAMAAAAGDYSVPRLSSKSTV